MKLTPRVQNMEAMWLHYSVTCGGVLFAMVGPKSTKLGDQFNRVCHYVCAERPQSAPGAKPGTPESEAATLQRQPVSETYNEASWTCEGKDSMLPGCMCGILQSLVLQNMPVSGSAGSVHKNTCTLHPPCQYAELQY